MRYQPYSHCSYCGTAFPAAVIATETWPRTCVHCGQTSFRNPIPVCVVIVPIQAQGQMGILAVRRSIPPRVGELALPGGFVNYGETWQEAGARELFEESGLRLDPGELREFRVRSAPDGTLIIFALAPLRPAEALPPFFTNEEASERVVLSAPAPMAFELHTEMIGLALALFQAGPAQTRCKMTGARGQRITILAHGTRGDVQPYLALALGLARAGHQVRLAAPEMFREMVESYAHPRVEEQGLPVEFFPLPGDPRQLMRAATAVGPIPGPVRMILPVIGYIAPVVHALIQAARAACADADLVIHTLLTSIIGHQLAVERGVRDLGALIFPVFTPTTSFPNPLFPHYPRQMHLLGRRAGSFGPRYNYLTHREFNRVYYLGHRIAIRRLNRCSPGLLAEPVEWPFGNLDVLPPESRPAHPAPILYGISRHSLPCPALWEDICAHLTGYWFLDAPPHWQPPDGLVRFLESGPPPVFVGFGSLIPRNARRLARLSLEALRLSGQRGVLLSGWGGLADTTLPETVYSLHEIPYDWLFPRLAATVHHAGMGTTAAALRAGIPSVTAPFTFDQPFWARQLYTLGAGTRPIPNGQVSAERLAAAIRVATEDTTLRERAAELGRLIRAEDGVSAAVRLIEKILAGEQSV